MDIEELQSDLANEYYTEDFLSLSDLIDLLCEYEKKRATIHNKGYVEISETDTSHCKHAEYVKRCGILQCRVCGKPW